MWVGTLPLCWRYAEFWPVQACFWPAQVMNPDFWRFNIRATALVAQLVARRSDKAKVIGSSPVEIIFWLHFLWLCLFRLVRLPTL